MRDFQCRQLVQLTLLLVIIVPASAAATELGFLPRPEKFTFSSGPVTLTPSGHASFSCKSSSSGTGKLTSDKTVKVDLDLKECYILGNFIDLRSLGDSIGVILINRTATVCLLSGTSTFGLEIPMSEGTTALHVEAPVGGALYIVKGSLIAQILSSKKGKTFALDISGSGTPKCVGSKESTLTMEENSGEPIALSESFSEPKLSFENEVELESGTP